MIERHAEVSYPSEWAALSSRERERLEKTVDAVPADARTGLEIGFHDFRLTRGLERKLDLVSIDLPRKVDQPGNARLVFSGIQRLPFRDAAFDIVLCTEVLEHLPDDVLQVGVRELSRVSRKYLLLSVPYRQRVWNEVFRCAHCGMVANTMDHVRFFDDRLLLRLFPGATLLTVELVGSINGYAPDWLYWTASRIGNAWQGLVYRDACPGCHRPPKAVTPNVLGYILQRIIWRMERRARPRPAWVLALLRL